METGGTSSNGSAENGELDPRIAEIDAAANSFSPVAKTLSGDLRDELLDRLRQLPTPWQQLSEGAQRVYAGAIDDFCRELVRRAVKLIEANRRVTIDVQLEEIAFKTKGVSAKLGIGAMEPRIRHALVDARGKDILIVVAEAADYIGERAPARIDKQQPDLPLDKTAAEEKAQEKVEADLDTVIASDESEPVAGAIPDQRQLREEAERNPRQAGRAAALQGLSESHNPLDHPSIESADWLRGHHEGMTERQAAAVATSGKRRRRANGPDGAAPVA